MHWGKGFKYDTDIGGTPNPFYLEGDIGLTSYDYGCNQKNNFNPLYNAYNATTPPSWCTGCSTAGCCTGTGKKPPPCTVDC